VRVYWVLDSVPEPAVLANSGIRPCQELWMPYVEWLRGTD